MLGRLADGGQRRRRRCPGLGALLLALLVAGAAEAQPPVAADEMEARVRSLYFEGFPLSAGRNPSAAAVERLIAMLDDDAERDHWANIIFALGASRSPEAFPALAAFAARRPRGEVGRGRYQARMALPVAIGHLAQDDDAAFAWLNERARRPGTDPGWSRAALRGTELGRLLRRRAITGLAVSGRPEAEATLSELALAEAATSRGRAGGEPSELAQHLHAARALRERVHREGPDRVFAPHPGAVGRGTGLP